MKFRSTSVICVLTSLVAIAAQATELSGPKSFDTCSYFQYSMETRSYVCSFPSGRVQVADFYETERELNALTQKIAELEARIKKLENPTQSSK